MQLAPIFLVAAVLAVDGGLAPVGSTWGLSRLMTALAAVGPLLPALLLTWLGVRHCTRLMARGRVPGPIMLADRFTRWGRTAVVFIHIVGVTVFGWLEVVRSFTGDLVFVDEALAITPALLGLGATWWIYYPVERRLRDALLIRRLDDGLPVYALPGRLGYVLLQARLHLFLLLIPVLLILLAKESADRIVPWLMGGPDQLAVEIATLGAAVLVFVLSPLLARWLLDVRPMPPGGLRDALIEICRTHQVRMRELLLWNTNGSMINAAVMGLVAPLRYVMITDALIETLRRDQVRAVMAHEIGHVRRRHLPWLLACLMAVFVLAWELLTALAGAIDLESWLNQSQWADALGLAFSGLHLVLGLLAFGWVCRRFERQADTFAVQHLSGMTRHTSRHEKAILLVSEEAVQAMRGALDTIARMNTIDRNRRSWRHGSIAWRERYLGSIVGQPVHRLPIDRLMRWIKFGAAATLFVSMALQVMNHRESGESQSESVARRVAAGPAAPALLP